jgi:hypothetical protein
MERQHMTILQIDRILAAYHRTGDCKGIPESKRISAVAQALGISEEMVREALEAQGVEA